MDGEQTLTVNTAGLPDPAATELLLNQWEPLACRLARRFSASAASCGSFAASECHTKIKPERSTVGHERTCAPRGIRSA